MTTGTLIRDLATQGIELSTTGGKLRVEGPEHLITSELQTLLHQQKPELIRELTLTREISRQVDRLVPHRTAYGEVVFVHPDHRAELDKLGLLSDWPASNLAAVAEPTQARHQVAVDDAGLRERCLWTAEAAAWPSVELRPGERVGGGEDGWHRFTQNACSRDVKLALAALRDQSGKSISTASAPVQRPMNEDLALR